jgi:hypothetical protein
VIVYRVENANGEGPYSAGFRIPGTEVETQQREGNTGEWRTVLKPRSLGAIHSDDTHPGYCDFYRDLSGYVFGFPSMAALVEWFGDLEEDLAQAGYHINCYDIPKKEVIFGRSKRQVIFPRKEAAAAVVALEGAEVAQGPF